MNIKIIKKSINSETLAQQYIIPDWPVADSIKAIVTMRNNGFSQANWNSFNLAMHVNDEVKHVQQNRQILNQLLPAEPFWLEQTHSPRIIEVDNSLTSNNENSFMQANNVVLKADGSIPKAGGSISKADGSTPEADGSYSLQSNQVCTVLTADCLPILFCSENAIAIAAVHAGWRGLALGIIDNAVQLLCRKTKLLAQDIIVWLGPAISKQHFEVGFEVKQQFISVNPQYEAAFTKSKQYDNKYMADIYLLAKINLQQIGVTKIYGGDFCTYSDEEKFYSYRRDGITGRMASLIWKTD